MSALELFQAKFVKPNDGRTLVVGSKIYGDKVDRRRLFKNAVGVDMEDGQGVDRVLDLEDPLPNDIGTFAHIECMSVLEHSRRPWLLAANLERLLDADGTIFVSVPWVWRFHPYDHDYYRFSRQGIEAIFPGIEWEELSLVTDKIEKGDKVEATRVNGHPFIARAETCGFGRKRGD